MKQVSRAATTKQKPEITCEYRNYVSLEGYDGKERE